MSDFKGNLLSFISSTEEKCFSRTKQEERGGDLSYWTVGGSSGVIMSSIEITVSMWRFNLLPLSSHSSNSGKLPDIISLWFKFEQRRRRVRDSGRSDRSGIWCKCARIWEKLTLKSLPSRSPRWSDSLSVAPSCRHPGVKSYWRDLKAFFTGRCERTRGRGGFGPTICLRSPG